MIPPFGFEATKYPLRHRLIYGAGLSLGSSDRNTILMPLVMHSNEMDVAASTIQVNPHNTGYETDSGPLCRKGSIIDKLSISLKFSMLDSCQPAHLAAGTAGPNFDDGTYKGDDVPAFNFLWRPFFNIFGEKLDAADQDTSTTVAAILALTKDETFEDVVPITTNKLTSAGPSDLVQPMSTVNAVQVFGDFNLTTNTAMEDHVFDEDLLQEALRRYTIKGALRSCIGRTRHVTLTRDRPYKNFYIDKFVPSQIRRIMEYGFFGIQVHMPIDTEQGQLFMLEDVDASTNHLGIKMISNYHEWNIEHDQGEGSS